MKQTIKKIALSSVALTLICGVSLNAANMNSQVVPTKHNKNLTLGQIADITPGLGTVMIEYGKRFYIAYYAAKAGNWDLARYQIKEQTEIQEVGEITRPGHAQELKAFEHAYLDPLTKAINNKDWNDFTAKYAAATEACNACHVGTGHGYIKYRLPAIAPVIPSMQW